MSRLRTLASLPKSSACGWVNITTTQAHASNHTVRSCAVGLQTQVVPTACCLEGFERNLAVPQRVEGPSGRGRLRGQFAVSCPSGPGLLQSENGKKVWAPKHLRIQARQQLHEAQFLSLQCQSKSLQPWLPPNITHRNIATTSVFCQYILHDILISHTAYTCYLSRPQRQDAGSDEASRPGPNSSQTKQYCTKALRIAITSSSGSR